MPRYKNTSEQTFERPGDGEDAPGWTAEPGDTVEAEQNPAPGSFEEAGDSPPAAEPAPEPAPAEAGEPEE